MSLSSKSFFSFQDYLSISYFTRIKYRKWFSLKEENEPDIFNGAGKNRREKGQ